MNYQSIVLTADRADRQPPRAGAAGRYRHPRLSLVQRSWPLPSANQVLLKVHCASICGTDSHVMQTDADGYSCSSVPAGNWEAGIQFGHELAAQVVAVGPGACAFRVGDYVTADSLVPCRGANCRTCRGGQWNACPQAYLLGLQADGVFGELALVPASSIHSIDPLITRYGLARALRVACLAEPVGVALHAFSQARRWVQARDPSVLVLGGGPIGQFFAWKACLAGCRRVVIVEPNSARAGVARLVAHVVVPPEQLDATLCRHEFGQGPDVVFDACGKADTDFILNVLAPGGALVSAARTGQQVCFPSDSLMTHGQAIIGTRGHVGHVPAAIDLLGNGGMAAETFTTRTLEGLPQLLAALREPSQLANELKVICRVSSVPRPRRDLATTLAEGRAALPLPS